VIDMKAFGSRLRLLREEKELNQIELSKVFSLANSTISQYEAGNRLPDAHTLEKLTSYFNVSVDYLLCLTNTRHERRHLADRRKFSGSLILDEGDEATQEHPMDAYEAKGNRMIGPELAYSAGLEAAAKAAGFALEIEVLEIAHAIPPGEVSAILGLAPGEQALRNAQIQHIDGTPSRVMTSWLPLDLFDGLTDHQGKPLLKILEKTKGIYAVKVEERIRASKVTPELANMLNAELGSSALEIQRVVHSDIGRVLEVSFISSAGMFWELAYTYAAGGRISAPDWAWMRHTPA